MGAAQHRGARRATSVAAQPGMVSGDSVFVFAPSKCPRRMLGRAFSVSDRLQILPGKGGQDRAALWLSACARDQRGLSGGAAARRAAGPSAKPPPVGAEGGPDVAAPLTERERGGEVTS